MDEKPEDRLVDANRPQSAPPVPDEMMDGVDAPAETADSEGASVADDASVSGPVADAATEPAQAAAVVPMTTDDNRFKCFFRSYWHRKRWTLPVTFIVLIAGLAAIPLTRYELAGLVWRQDFSVMVVDSHTGEPVTNALVSLDGKTVKTSNKGRATMQAKVGHRNVEITKKYYKANSVKVVVPILKQTSALTIQLVATGRQVPVIVVNKLTGQPVNDALVRVADTEGRTDRAGKVTVVLPATAGELKAKFSADGYNVTTGMITVTDQSIKRNAFELTPAGKVYFLSKLSGKIDVVKTNLDGSNRQTVLAGTGTESDTDTILLASRDWKYLALKSSRNKVGAPQMYLIDTTANDKLTSFDSGNADFAPVGWYDDHFLYTMTRNGVQSWQTHATALKTYDASSGKLTTIDQTDAEGTGPYDYGYTNFSSFYILHDEVVYTKNWYSSAMPNHLDGKSVSLLSVKPDGSNKKTIRDFPVPAGIQYVYYVALSLYEPGGMYVQVPGASAGFSYFEYEAGKLTAKSISDTTFAKGYPTYLLSPSGQQTFWSDSRDGKNSLFVGDASGRNAKQVAALSEYVPYGWYTNDYLLLSKNSSELYILPISGNGVTQKVTDYHKPSFDSRGYGYGYGGF